MSEQHRARTMETLLHDFTAFLPMVTAFCGEQGWGRLAAEADALAELPHSAWFGGAYAGQCQAIVELVLDHGSPTSREQMLEAFLEHEQLLPPDFEVLHQVVDAILDLEVQGDPPKDYWDGVSTERRGALLDTFIQNEVEPRRARYLRKHRDAYLELLAEVYD